MVNSNTEYTYASEGDDKNLTYEKFIATFRELKKSIEFCAFTMSPQAYNHAQSYSDFNKPDLFGRSVLDSMTIHIVSRQKSPVIKWSDRDDLNLYLEMMGEKEPSGDERNERNDRIAALVIIGIKSRLDYESIVIKTLHHPTDFLIAATRMIGHSAEEIKRRAVEMVEAISESAKTFEDLSGAIGKSKKPKPVRPRRFYEKFNKKRRRK